MNACIESFLMRAQTERFSYFVFVEIICYFFFLLILQRFFSLNSFGSKIFISLSICIELVVHEFIFLHNFTNGLHSKFMWQLGNKIGIFIAKIFMGGKIRWRIKSRILLIFRDSSGWQLAAVAISTQ